MKEHKMVPLSCPYSIEQLEQFRDVNGFLDLTFLSLSSKDASRETRGNQNRIKNWVAFRNQLVLLKGETILEQERNDAIFGELIVEEIGRFFNIPMAHYDLVKLKDEEQHEALGVLSFAIPLQEGEQLVSLHALIGEEDEDEFLDATNYSFTIKKLKSAFQKRGYSQEMIEQVLEDYQKRLAFHLLLVETDKHIENISFILSEKQVRLSPNYDSEASLLLDNEQSTIQKLLDNYFNLEQTVRLSVPRIGVYQPVEEGGFGSYFMDTLEALIEEDSLYDYCSQLFQIKIDMDSIFEKIENRIHAQLPLEVKLLAKYSYLARRRDCLQIIKGEMEN